MRDARNRRSRSYCIFRYLLLYTFHSPDSRRSRGLEVSSSQSFQWTFLCLSEGLSGVPRGSWSTPVSERDCKGTPFFFTCKLFRNFFQTFFTTFSATSINALTATHLRIDDLFGIFSGSRDDRDYDHKETPGMKMNDCKPDRMGFAKTWQKRPIAIFL